MLTPADVYTGKWRERLAIRAEALAAAFEQYPDRFVKGAPKPKEPPAIVAINPTPKPPRSKHPTRPRSSKKPLNSGNQVSQIIDRFRRMIFLSAEYEGRGRTCEEFIDDLYRTFLFREASPDELDIWCAGEPGWNRAEAMSIIARSQEARESFEALFPGRHGEPLRDFVGAMYAGILDRLPEHGGLEAWTSTFPAQPGPEQRHAARFMTGTLFDSEEFRGNLPQDEAAAARRTVVHLYRTFMNRYPMTPEIDFWAGELLAQEWTLDEVLDYFAASAEFGERLAEYFGG